MLLEREAELAAVRAAAAGAAGGLGRVLVVEGDAGIGKTSLLARLGELPEWSGHRILTARGSDLESQYAFGLVRQLFEPALGTDGVLAGPAARASCVFDPDQETGPAAEVATLHGLFWLTANLCSEPLALVIDDLHWADAASLRYLAYLQPRMQALPLLVLAAVRTGERPVDDLLLARVTSDPGTELLRPAPLSARATSQLLDETLGRADETFAAACVRATSGNPLLVKALAAAVRQAGVEPVAANARQVVELAHRAVSRWVALRLAAVPDETVAAARAVAVLGQGARLDAVRDLAGLDPLGAAEAVEQLAWMGLVEAGDRVGFVHPLVAAAVYGDLGVRERAESHAKAAAVLERHGGTAEQVGVHLLKVPPGAGPGTVDWLRRAAATARSRGSAEAAFAFLSRCLDEPLDPAARLDLLTDAAEVAIQVDLRAAAGLLTEARDLVTDPVRRARIGVQLGNALGLLIDPEAAVAAFTAARDELPPAEEGLRRELEATLLVGALIVPGGLRLADRAAELAALPPHDSLGGRLLEATIALQEMRRCDPAGIARARAALADGELVRAMNGEGGLVSGWLVLLAADDPLALESLDAAVAQAHLNGSVRALAAAYGFRAAGRLWSGQLADAETDARASLRMTGSGRVDMDPTFAGAYLAGALLERGSVDEAVSVLGSLGMPAAEPADRPRYYTLDLWARTLLNQGRYAESLAAARVAGQVWQAYGFDNPALGCWRSVAAESAHHLGRPEPDLIETELALARRWGAPRGLGRVLRTAGALAADEDLLRESVAVLEPSPARLERAASLFELGAFVRRSGRRTEARELLTRALDEADVCGAVPLAEKAAGELRVAGFRPRRNRVTGPDSLTPSELRVASLAAGGATNREIAQELFVTTKTIELHLSNVYRKLGVAGRQDLALP